MRAETHSPQPSRLGHSTALWRAQVLAVSVPVLVSFFVWWSLLAVLPLWAAALVLALVVGSMCVALVPSAQPDVVRLLYRARRATGPDHEMLSRATATLCERGQGPPVICFYVGQAGAGVPAVAVGSRSVVVDRVLVDALVRGRLTPEQAATAIAPAAALVSAGATAADVAVLIWVLPWIVLRGVGTMLLHAWSRSLHAPLRAPVPAPARGRWQRQARVVCNEQIRRLRGPRPQCHLVTLPVGPG